MAVSKRLRYEVLRRDGHRCKYCGVTADEVKLTVDHVVPVALGGSDDAANLVAACGPCNAGKSATSPDAPLITEVSERDLQWVRALEIAAQGRRVERDERHELQAEFLSFWDALTEDAPMPDDWYRSLQMFTKAGLDTADLAEAVDIAAQARVPRAGMWRYFCGVCWRTVDESRELAAKIVTNWNA